MAQRQFGMVAPWCSGGVAENQAAVEKEERSNRVSLRDVINYSKNTKISRIPGGELNEINDRLSYESDRSNFTQNSCYSLLGREPYEICCQFCGHKGLTQVDYDFSLGTVISMLPLLVVGCCLPLFCVPCITGLKDAVHRCQNCEKIVGRTKVSCGAKTGGNNDD